MTGSNAAQAPTAEGGRIRVATRLGLAVANVPLAVLSMFALLIYGAGLVGAGSVVLAVGLVVLIAGFSLSVSHLEKLFATCGLELSESSVAVWEDGVRREYELSALRVRSVARGPFSVLAVEGETSDDAIPIPGSLHRTGSRALALRWRRSSGPPPRRWRTTDWEPANESLETLARRLRLSESR